MKKNAASLLKEKKLESKWKCQPTDSLHHHTGTNPSDSSLENKTTIVCPPSPAQTILDFLLLRLSLSCAGREEASLGGVSIYPPGRLSHLFPSTLPSLLSSSPLHWFSSPTPPSLLYFPQHIWIIEQPLHHCDSMGHRVRKAINMCNFSDHSVSF